MPEMRRKLKRLARTGVEVIRPVDEPDLCLTLRQAQFLVSRSTMSAVNRRWAVSLSSDAWAESNQGVIQLYSRLDVSAMELILRAAHGETESALEQRFGETTFEFIEDIVEVCKYYMCGYLVPSYFKALLAPGDPQELPCLRAIIAAFELGWLGRSGSRLVQDCCRENVHPNHSWSKCGSLVLRW